MIQNKTGMFYRCFYLVSKYLVILVVVGGIHAKATFNEKCVLSEKLRKTATK